MGRSHAGFSTVEVLVALIVFDVGLLGAVTASALTSRLLTEARNRSRVTLAASERIELVRNAARSSRRLRCPGWRYSTSWRWYRASSGPLPDRGSLVG